MDVKNYKNRFRKIDNSVWIEENLIHMTMGKYRNLKDLTNQLINTVEQQAEKVDQLQQENERLKKFLNWEQEEAQGLDKEVTFQLEQLKQAQTKTERYEKVLKEISVYCDTAPFNHIAKQALEGDK